MVRKLKVVSKNKLIPIFYIFKFIVLYWKDSLFMMDAGFFKVGQ